MPVQVLMPALSPTMTEGKLVRWLKKEGEDEYTNNKPTLKQSKTAYRDEYLAIMFLKHSNPIMFRSLNKEISNAHARGSDQYPKTMASAVDLLVTYQDPYARKHQYNPNYGLSFLTKDNDGSNMNPNCQGQILQGGRGPMIRGGRSVVRTAGLAEEGRDVADVEDESPIKRSNPGETTEIQVLSGPWMTKFR